MRLQHYDVTIRYKPGKDLLLADGLSRLPSTDNQHIGLDIQINFVTFSNEKLVTLRQETSRDAILHELKEIIIQGWPEKMKDLPRMLQPYWSFRDELSNEDRLVIKGSRVIIPVSMQKLVLDRIHEGHQGITKCQLRAKDCVYWTSINRDIEDIVQQCSICQETSRSQTKETLIPHELPTRPWQYVGTDLFHYGENDYLIIADYYSNSEEFATFASNWELEHITSSPHYPQSNGFIERIIQTVKNTLDKAKRSNKDPDMALLTLRTTPLDSKLPSPAELLNGRKMRSNLPLHLPTREGQKQDVYENFKKKQDTQKQYYDRGAKDQQALLPGQAVRVQDHISGRWTPATVVEKSQEPRSYIVETQDGGILRRNRRHIKQTPQPKHPLPDEHHADEPTGTTVNMDNEQDHVSKAPKVVPQEQESTCDGTRTRSGPRIASEECKLPLEAVAPQIEQRWLSPASPAPPTTKAVNHPLRD
ncbi:uncharacterized protein K02A2.6-like [Penaeus indicus]|uniref:uncharacterized protein K02A2.6-like n=1 Tax=Penaeus indicus TaxID=29960 RepID=UPI00300CDFCB